MLRIIAQIIEVVVAHFCGNKNEVLLRHVKEDGLIADFYSRHLDHTDPPAPP